MAFFLFLLTLLTTFSSIHADRTTPDIFLIHCSPNNSTNVASFVQNFVTTRLLVTGNITDMGFGIGVTGGPVPVYGLGQCYNYLTSVDCQLCYAQSRRLDSCLPALDARIYLDGCFFRYASQDFYKEADDASDRFQCSNSSIGGSMFRQNVVELTSNLTLGAETDSQYFRVNSTVAAPGVTVYGMAQCWKSLNASGCRNCLESGRRSVVQCLPASDGMAMNAGCFVRYSTSPFYMESTTGSSGTLDRRSRLGVILGSIFGALIIAGVAVFWIRRKGTKTISEDVSGQEVSEEIMRFMEASSLSFKYEDLKDATGNFSEINKVGQGGFGAVYKGVLADGRVLAVKKLFFNTRQRADQFIHEVNLVSQVQHKNLVKLLGCSIEGPESLVVYEYLSNTSLEKFLYDAFRKTILDWAKRFHIIVGIAEGLAYLHSSSEVRIIHRDIKPSNILLDERFNAKVSDFGLARYFAEDQSHLSTGLAGTFGYMAPEYIVHGQLTEKADVYSYGILVIEILTGRKNQNSITTSSEGHSLMSLVWHHFNSNSLIEQLDELLQGQCSEEEALKVFHVALLCTQSSPILRPPMWKVVQMLTSRSKDLPPPTEPPFTRIKGSDIDSSGSRASENRMPLSILQGR